MAYENILVERSEGIATLTINRPKSLNALSNATVAELNLAVEAIEDDREVKALILTGAGDKAFAAGADISEMTHMASPAALTFAELGHRLCDALEALPIPTIAAVNGFALGGGCELAMACDLVYAAESAQFGQPEVNLSVIPGWGGTSRLARRVGPHRAREMIFTGDRIDAKRAWETGMVLAILPKDGLMAHCRAVAKKIASKGPLAVSQAKKVITVGAGLPLQAANALERQAFSALFGSEDQKEGTAAFLEKRAPHFKGR
ncbi:MAG: enoyl-CoA hydratase/isomerase family protein [Myxococcales bacterium]